MILSYCFQAACQIFFLAPSGGVPGTAGVDARNYVEQLARFFYLKVSPRIEQITSGQRDARQHRTGGDIGSGWRKEIITSPCLSLHSALPSPAHITRDEKPHAASYPLRELAHFPIEEYRNARQSQSLMQKNSGCAMGIV
jgi:hypothetical protein